MLQCKKRLLAIAGIAMVAVTILLIQTPRADVGCNSGYTVAGCWWATVYLGDPDDPTTPQIPMIATLNEGGTLTWCSTTGWGDHPYLPGQKSIGSGTWTRRGMEVDTKGLWFDELGGGAGISVGRALSTVTFRGPDEMVGFTDFDFIPCPDGTLGCTDPTQSPFLQMGDGVGPFPMVYRRLR